MRAIVTAIAVLAAAFAFWPVNAQTIIGNGCNPNGIIGNGGSCIPSGSASPTFAPYTATPTPGPTPTVASGGYYVGGFFGGVCVPKNAAQLASNTAVWMPWEGVCWHGAPGVYQGAVPPVTAPSGAPTPGIVSLAGRDGGVHNGTDPNVQGIVLQNVVPGGAYIVAVPSNGYGGGYPAFNITVNIATNAQVAATYAIVPSSARTHQFYSGCFIQTGTFPFGFTNSDSTLNQSAIRTTVDSGCQMGRIDITPFNTDLHLDGGAAGVYNFTFVDQAIAEQLALGAVPYFEMDAGPIQATGGTQPIEPSPGEYQAWVAAFLQHLKAYYPTVGTAAIPLLVSCCVNEPNDSTYAWDARQSSQPTAYSDANGGEAIYQRALWVATQAAGFANAKVYMGELAHNDGTLSEVNTLTRWYTSTTFACRSSAWAGTPNATLGICFDGLAYHFGSVGIPSEPDVTCEYGSDGATWACINDLLAVGTSYSDPIPRFMFSESLIPAYANNGNPPYAGAAYDYGAGNQAGQAAWVAGETALCNALAKCDGFVYASIYSDQEYCKPWAPTATAFCLDGLNDTTSPPYVFARLARDTYCANSKQITIAQCQATYLPNPNASPPPGIVAYTQSSSGYTDSGGSPVVTFSSGPSMPHMLVGIVAGDSTAYTTPSGWTALTCTNPVANEAAFYKISTSTESSTTFASSAGAASAMIYELPNGAGVPTCVDTSSTSSTAVTFGPITPTIAQSAVIEVVFPNNGSTVVPVPAGYIGQTQIAGNYHVARGAYEINPTVGMDASVGITLSGGSAANGWYGMAVLVHP